MIKKDSKSVYKARRRSGLLIEATMNIKELWLRPVCILTCRFRIPCLITVALILLVWSSFTFCSDIYYAATIGDLEEIKTLLKNNPNLAHIKNKNGWTPLHVAADMGHKEIALLLIRNNAEINAKDIYGRTPLHNKIGDTHCLKFQK
jgi:hypothetical protein